MGSFLYTLEALEGLCLGFGIWDFFAFLILGCWDFGWDTGILGVWMLGSWHTAFACWYLLSIDEYTYISSHKHASELYDP